MSIPQTSPWTINGNVSDLTLVQKDSGTATLNGKIEKLFIDQGADLSGSCKVVAGENALVWLPDEIYFYTS